MCVCVYICVRACMWVLYVGEHNHVCVLILCVCVCFCMCVCMCLCVCACVYVHLPDEGVMGVMGVAMIPLALRAAICCICTAATVATGDKYADWATRACCWTNWRDGASRRRREGGDTEKE